jgi:hypothetical protein
VIPTVDNIVDGLIAGTMNRDEAISWIHAHIDAAQDRDELAALAMNGLMGTRDWDATLTPAAEIAQRAYNVADAMIKAKR